MNVHSVLLHLCAAAVIVPGMQLLAALAAKDCGETPRPAALLRAWRRPAPKAAAGLVGTMVVLGVAQVVVPAMIDALERRPHGEWWRAVTALTVQSSGWFQLLLDLTALAVVAPVVERCFGPGPMLLVFATSGVIAQTVSMAGWSLRGSGDSVAICGLVGALATWYAARGSVVALRRAVLLIPAAGFVLCLLTNNHGVGFLVGCVLGVGRQLLPVNAWSPDSE